MLFQEGALFDSMTVSENVAFPSSTTSRPRGRDRPAVMSYLDLVGMRDNEHAMPQELSGGMNARCPCPGHDPGAALPPLRRADLGSGSGERGNRRIDDQPAPAGKSITSLVVTHDIDLTRYIADRIALLEDGRISAQSGREEAFRRLPDLRTLH